MPEGFAREDLLEDAFHSFPKVKIFPPAKDSVLDSPAFAAFTTVRLPELMAIMVVGIKTMKMMMRIESFVCITISFYDTNFRWNIGADQGRKCV